jgi:hypothetical protein
MSFQLMPHRPPPAVVGPIIRALAAAGVTPNAVSLVGFLGNVAAAVLVAGGWLVAVGIVIVVE